MTWLGVTNHQDGRFSKSGLDNQARNDTHGPLLERGTLMFETHVAGNERPQDLLGLAHPFPWPRELAFRAIPGGGIAMLHRHNADVSHAAIRWANDGRAYTLRVTYAWNAPEGWGRLALERPEGNRIVSRPVHMPKPFLTEDLRDISLAHPARTMSQEVVFTAISDVIQPIGPLPTLHPATPIATPRGYKPADTL